MKKFSLITLRLRYHLIDRNAKGSPQKLPKTILIPRFETAKTEKTRLEFITVTLPSFHVTITVTVIVTIAVIVAVTITVTVIVAVTIIVTVIITVTVIVAVIITVTVMVAVTIAVTVIVTITVMVAVTIGVIVNVAFGIFPISVLRCCYLINLFVKANFFTYCHPNKKFSYSLKQSKCLQRDSC